MTTAQDTINVCNTTFRISTIKLSLLKKVTALQQCTEYEHIHKHFPFFLWKKKYINSQNKVLYCSFDREILSFILSIVFQNICNHNNHFQKIITNANGTGSLLQMRLLLKHNYQRVTKPVLKLQLCII